MINIYHPVPVFVYGIQNPLCHKPAESKLVEEKNNSRSLDNGLVWILFLTFFFSFLPREKDRAKSGGNRLIMHEKKEKNCGGELIMILSYINILNCNHGFETNV